MNENQTTLVMLSSRDLQPHFTASHNSSPVASWDSKLSNQVM